MIHFAAGRSEALTEASYYLTVERNRYRFSLKENLNKRFADRRATIRTEAVQERIRDEIQMVFAAGSGVDRVFFPDKTSQVPDRPAVTLVVLPPEMSLKDQKATAKSIESVTRQYGTSSRTFKSALIFCIPEAADALCDEARNVLAWEDIDDEADDLKLDETQVRQLDSNTFFFFYVVYSFSYVLLGGGVRPLREGIWFRTSAARGRRGAPRDREVLRCHRLRSARRGEMRRCPRRQRRSSSSTRSSKT